MFPTTTEATMSSKEIANLTGKRHGDVIRDIRAMVSSMGDEVAQAIEEVRDRRGYTAEFIVGWQEAATLITGYSAKARHAVISAMGRHAVVEAIGSVDFDDVGDELFVYAIMEASTGMVKIGISKDPERRLKQLQTGNSSELELVAYRKAYNRYADERECHRLNSDIHVRGEWFESNASLKGPMGEMKLVEVA